MVVRIEMPLLEICSQDAAIGQARYAALTLEEVRKGLGKDPGPDVKTTKMEEPSGRVKTVYLFALGEHPELGPRHRLFTVQKTVRTEQ